MKRHQFWLMLLSLYVLFFALIFRNQLAPATVRVVSNEIVKCESQGGRLSMTYSDWYEAYLFTCAVSSKTLYRDLQ